ncbi:MAG TPA: glycoside hydrolase family 99-like domain-containing protein [Bacteroidales bacterium]|nr:glycoside hydrolase family 99-like domain-containing protein [Bacteroidales bacterium]HPS61624.1 glycoside hydrolase family 99-like domain-containing protein [Bacteroidales bacterium]
MVNLLAFYLPQFHPIPENDAWWGKGFTEWTNTTRAKPLFPGHRQPHLPADLGFYDLRSPESREAQANLARQHGLSGFIYWHYWFGDGKRLLERPFEEVVRSGKPDFPFCLAWANQSWTGVWHGLDGRTLIEQRYPGKQDHIDHFHTLLPAFSDRRYIRIGNRPLFFVYEPATFPNLREFTGLWNGLAIRNGLGGIYFVGVNHLAWDYRADGFDGVTVYMPGHYIDTYQEHLFRAYKNSFKRHILRRFPLVIQYEEILKAYHYDRFANRDFIPCIVPNWDNTPRSGQRGMVFQGSTPALFGRHLRDAIRFASEGEREHRMVIIKSWNEWAEGNYLEPDREWGTARLEEIAKAVMEGGTAS